MVVVLLIVLLFSFSCLKLPKLLGNAKVCNVSTLCTFKRMTNYHTEEVQTLEFELITDCFVLENLTNI